MTGRSGIGDAVGLAWGTLRARPRRTIMLALGPMLGAAALVGVISLGESAKSEIRDQLTMLGDNLVLVDARSPTSISNDSKLPGDVVARIRSVTAVEKVSALTAIQGVSVRATAEQSSTSRALPIEVAAADFNLPEVLPIRLEWGRFLQPFDRDARIAVIGSELARAWMIKPYDLRTISLNGRAYGVVGVMESMPFLTEFDRSVLLTSEAAQADWSDDGRPSQVLVRVNPGQVASTAALLPKAVTLGAARSVSISVPSDLLEAGTRVDQTLQLVGYAMALLALGVGGIGIANVMAISVLQRRSEIGIRRALGQTRRQVIAQFLSEGSIVGLLGGIGGTTIGVAIVIAAAAVQHWTPTVPGAVLAVSLVLSLIVATLASAYPAKLASNLEPLDTLRSG